MKKWCRWIVGLGTVAALAACAPAARGTAERLRISARDAEREAHTVAASWQRDATLRYLEGEGVAADGYVQRERGFWRLVYQAPGRADQLAVTVTPVKLEQVTRPAQSPPGIVLGDAQLAAWVDSPQVMDSVKAAGAATLLAGGDAALSLLLVPLRPPQWTVRLARGSESREWQVNAVTGAGIP
ncbi:MAG: hypothetical protein HY561_07235 [Gemmatimonadetes bacterium]|nr:hypothetical protein [Gemmatimonadota bacterium]